MSPITTTIDANRDVTNVISIVVVVSRHWKREILRSDDMKILEPNYQQNSWFFLSVWLSASFARETINISCSDAGGAMADKN